MGSLRPDLENDRKYNRLNKRLDDYFEKYSYAINDRLHKLIQLHKKCCEFVPTMIFLEPLMHAFASFLPDRLRLEILAGHTEELGKQCCQRIRVRIGECIQQIQKKE